MKQSTTTAKVRAVFALAGIGVAIWVLIEIAISAVHGVEGVAGFRVPPGSVSEGEAWGIYAIYVALVLGSAVPLDKTETVKLPAHRISRPCRPNAGAGGVASGSG